MKNNLTIIFISGILLLVVLACCNMPKENLAKITFSDDERGTKTFTAANQGDKIYALSMIKNTSGKHLIRWKVTDSNGEEIKLPEDQVILEGERAIWLTLTLKPQAFPEGKYNFEVKLLSENGDKEFDSQTATLEVK